MTMPAKLTLWLPVTFEKLIRSLSLHDRHEVNISPVMACVDQELWIIKYKLPKLSKNDYTTLYWQFLKLK